MLGPVRALCMWQAIQLPELYLPCNRGLEDQSSLVEAGCVNRNILPGHVNASNPLGFNVMKHTSRTRVKKNKTRMHLIPSSDPARLPAWGAWCDPGWKIEGLETHVAALYRSGADIAGIGWALWRLCRGRLAYCRYSANRTRSHDRGFLYQPGRWRGARDFVPVSRQFACPACVEVFREFSSRAHWLGGCTGAICRDSTAALPAPVPVVGCAV